MIQKFYGLVFLLYSGGVMAGQDVMSQPVEQIPTIDGIVDKLWIAVPAIKTHDRVANIDIEVRSVHNDESIFFLIRYPDPSESRAHKFLNWDETLQSYRTGPKREDSFVLKWNMEPKPVDLTISGDVPYRADVWYWKANRTDPAGFADDKHHIYGQNKLKKSQFLVNRSGQQFYLTRLSDEGQSAYKSQTHEKFIGAEVPRYISRQPFGSRADVRAKGVWNDGYWTIEFFRKLQTGHSDDVQFDKKSTYPFGVSRFEIAGKPANPKLDQPLYESGDISELLTLILE